jgi:hypothetical protein
VKTTEDKEGEGEETGFGRTRKKRNFQKGEEKEAGNRNSGF